MNRLFSRFGFEGDFADVIQLWMAVFLQVVIFVLFITSLVEGHWLVAFTAATVFILTFMLSFIEWRSGIYIPAVLSTGSSANF